MWEMKGKADRFKARIEEIDDKAAVAASNIEWNDKYLGFADSIKYLALQIVDAMKSEAWGRLGKILDYLSRILKSLPPTAMHWNVNDIMALQGLAEKRKTLSKRRDDAIAAMNELFQRLESLTAAYEKKCGKRYPLPPKPEA
jgi:hypothetical protein